MVAFINGKFFYLLAFISEIIYNKNMAKWPITRNTRRSKYYARYKVERYRYKWI